MDRQGWCTAVRGVTKSQRGLSDGTGQIEAKESYSQAGALGGPLDLWGSTVRRVGSSERGTCRGGPKTWSPRRGATLQPWGRLWSLRAVTWPGPQPGPGDGVVPHRAAEKGHAAQDLQAPLCASPVRRGRFRSQIQAPHARRWRCRWLAAGRARGASSLVLAG